MDERIKGMLWAARQSPIRLVSSCDGESSLAKTIFPRQKTPPRAKVAFMPAPWVPRRTGQEIALARDESGKLDGIESSMSKAVRSSIAITENVSHATSEEVVLATAGVTGSARGPESVLIRGESVAGKTRNDSECKGNALSCAATKASWRACEDLGGESSAVAAARLARPPGNSSSRARWKRAGSAVGRIPAAADDSRSFGIWVKDPRADARAASRLTVPAR
ncbi:hypothetical protein BC828DRAFT_391860 [Blastocladiella britannica]|nr:hypothetical protein BC828DRAFT_391860 [Blastocladiella britannica]